MYNSLIQRKKEKIMKKVVSLALSALLALSLAACSSSNTTSTAASSAATSDAASSEESTSDSSTSTASSAADNATADYFILLDVLRRLVDDSVELRHCEDNLCIPRILGRTSVQSVC